jgi:hypothetical protein
MNKILKNKKNRITGLAIVLAGMISIGFFMTGCQEEESDFFAKMPLYKTYLSITDFSSKTTFSNAEKRILIEAMGRIEKYLQIDDGHWTISKTAQELNMAEDIYDIFNTFFSLGDYLQQDIKPVTIRLKSGEESSSGGICDTAYAVIMGYLSLYSGSDNASASANILGTDFSLTCFNNYWSGTGSDMNLTNAQFDNIKTFIPSRNNSNGLTVFSKNGTTYYKGSVSFYNTPYALSLGTATITYNASFQPVGLADTYDFNVSGWNSRPGWNDETTAAAGIVGTLCGAEQYDIRYGIY